MLNSIYIIVVVLTIIIAMSTIGVISFKGIKEALETKRKQIEQIVATQNKQSSELARLSASFKSTQIELKDALEQLAQISQALDKFSDSQLNSVVTIEEPKFNSEDIAKNSQTKEKQEKQQVTFYAKAYDEANRQVVEAKNAPNASSVMPFKVATIGNAGTILFNAASFLEISKNAQVLVFPFCQVNMKVGGNPQGIENIEAGEVKLINGEWIITKKPIIKII